MQFFFFKFIKNSYKGSHTHITLFFHFLAYCVLHSNLAQRIISYSKLYFFIIHEKRSKVMNMGVGTYKEDMTTIFTFVFVFLREMCRIFWWCPYIILGICRNKLYMGLHMSKLLTICILLGLCVIRVTKQIQISDFYLSCLLSQNYVPSNLYVFPKSHMTQISITENQNQIIYCLEATLCAS